jgi:hypothetical protein
MREFHQARNAGRVWPDRSYEPGDPRDPRETAPSGDRGWLVMHVVLPLRGFTRLPARHLADHKMTHVQVCLCNPVMIKGVLRVPDKQLRR